MIHKINIICHVHGSWIIYNLVNYNGNNISNIFNVTGSGNHNDCFFMGIFSTSHIIGELRISGIFATGVSFDNTL